MNTEDVQVRTHVALRSHIDLAGIERAARRPTAATLVQLMRLEAHSGDTQVQNGAEDEVRVNEARFEAPLPVRGPAVAAGGGLSHDC